VQAIGAQLGIDVEVAGTRARAHIRDLGGEPLRPHGDVALAALLLPAMRAGPRLRVTAPVSPVLLAGAAHIQEVWRAWDAALHPGTPWYGGVAIEVADTRPPAAHVGATTVGIEAAAVAGSSVAHLGATTASAAASTSASAAVAGEERVACFFTGGVDSFHAVLTDRHRIDALVYVHGFDVALGDRVLRDRVAASLREAARLLDLPLVELESDLKDLGARFHIGWDDYHGAALAAVAHALADRFDRLLVPATHTYAYLEGLGSHPVTDRLWSGDRMQLEHVGAGADRVAKVAVLAASDAARRYLRVCWENRDGAYNCGRCEKCVRTGVAIRIAGHEGAFALRSPSLREVASVRATGRASTWQELRRALVASGGSARLRRTIDLVLLRHQLHRWRWTRWVP